jgi:hypothetical protein
MRASLFSLFTAAIIAASPCDGFLDFINQANPALAQFAEAQDNSLLKIHLDVGQVDTLQSKKGYPKLTWCQRTQPPIVYWSNDFEFDHEREVHRSDWYSLRQLRARSMGNHLAERRKGRVIDMWF